MPVTSILMDTTTYDAFEPFGTNTATSGMLLKFYERRLLPHLTEIERAVYDRLTDPDHTGHRRIEQERIPLNVAHAALNEMANQSL